YYFNPREGTRAEKMEGQIEEKIKIQRLERLINEQIERQKRIKTASLPFETIGIVTSVTRDDSSRYLLRTEHNEYVSFLPLSNHKNGDVVYVRATELNGNTFRGEEIEKE
ncbi:MAG: tRNA (N6-isopentenyl adenosine(37)-C2)-methylthiotransferase MiaB, partial [Candidatus Ornithospirochaeta sp.]